MGGLLSHKDDSQRGLAPKEGYIAAVITVSSLDLSVLADQVSFATREFPSHKLNDGIE